MNKLALCLPLAAVATLGACAAPEEPRAVAPVTATTGIPVTSGTGAPVVAASPAAPGTVVLVPAAVLRPGTGVVDSVNAVPSLSASAGASQPAGASRLGIRMSDGTMQFVDYGDRDISVGQRVELTADGFIRKL